MFEVTRFGPVVRIRMVRTLLGRPLQWVNAFWVDGLLIDSGCSHTREELLQALEQEGLQVEQFVNTHTHEDHTGANALIQSRFRVAPQVHPLGLRTLIQPLTMREMPFYRQVVWGLVEPSLGRPLGDTVETDRYRFRVIHTPGHASDHIALFEERAGWLFSGDLLISPSLVLLRAEEDPNQLLDSMRKVAALPVQRLFCAHAYRLFEGTDPLQAKIARWEGIQLQAKQLGAEGLPIPKIVRKLLGRKNLLELLTLGDFHRRHLIQGLMR